MKLRIFTLIMPVIILFSIPAFAGLDLDSARDQGLVGERLDGYVQVLKSSPEVEALVKDINQRRKQAYMQISAKNKQSVDIVARLAAPKIIAKLKPGNYYQDASGAWVKKE